MLSTEIINFICSHYLSKGSELEPATLSQSGNGFEIDIFKAGSRTRRRIGKITGGHGDAALSHESDVPGVLERLFHSPRVRKSERELLRELGDASVCTGGLAEGWIMRKDRYEPDGKTVARTEYVMGYALYLHVERKRRREREREKQTIADWHARLGAILEGGNKVPDGLAGQENRHLLWNFIEDMAAKLEPCSVYKEIFEVIWNKEQPWQGRKPELYVDFMIALAEIAAVRAHFDWKEIGARYYREIGGSKRFDPYKADFLEAAEEQIGCPLPLLGLCSAGTVTQIYFAGELSGRGGFAYPQGFLHAVTDVAVWQTEFRTACHTLWLTENRAVLTRMSAEPDFLLNSGSLIIGLDGQLRSGHRKLIKDVLTGSRSIGQVIVWCDGDKSGLDIARSVRALLPPASPARVKWIGPAAGDRRGEHPRSRLFRTWESYEAAALAGLDRNEAGEQEAEMGDRDIWNMWMEL
ncbi:hypothetical protein J2Z22_002563 [Paenibacillus forsythiae]|uniref:DUF2399 domain-containing protein n=1 Tax=Paenibacillus forsythiae TaxID=365616 RepID=A0ABU3H872_9BACL|nr:Toprim sub domain-containing protein [Paenibacillus forsythiae]MDT3427029.1 hypothetical protein [Paenibacillus forsythiae]